MAAHDQAWRQPQDVVAFAPMAQIEPDLQARTKGDFWGLLEQLQVTLLVSREYEHLLLALSARAGRPLLSWLPLPHPSGIAVDVARGEVSVASTRNPNHILTLRPAAGIAALRRPERPLLPVRNRFLPGVTYLHDLAFIGGQLYANSVAANAVVSLAEDDCRPVWWPRSIEQAGQPDISRNHLQLNSIAAGADLAGSYFTASAERPSSRRPGHRNWPVDRRGVLFSGATREPVARHLTRPHSARLYRGRVWLDNSGYGEMGMVADGRFHPLVRLDGWTRGLAFHDGWAFVGTSRVLPRFRQYAPGLDAETARCGLHCIDLASGRVAASLFWPAGNQIFAIEALPIAFADGLPFTAGKSGMAAARELFYSYKLAP